MKKKTLIITLVSIAFVTLVTTGLLIYGAIKGVAYVISHAGPQVHALKAQGLPDQISGLWGQLQKTMNTPECQSAISQLTNLQSWLLGAGENLIPQVGIACLGSHLKVEESDVSEEQQTKQEII